MARALLIFNPAAARANQRVVRSVSRVFSQEGWNLEVVGTTRPGHAEDLARQGVADGAELIAVYGGDGTTMQAVRGLVGQEVPVGLIPGGAGNLLAGNLRLPRNPTAAARVAARGVAKRIDLGRLRREEGERYFAVACGAGFDADLMARTSGAAKRRWRMGAYVAQFWGALHDVKLVAHTITVDGTILEVEAVMVMVANCGELMPPFFRLREGIAPDDGIFDVVVVNATTVVEGIDITLRMLTGRVKDHHRVRYARGRSVTVETAEPRPVQFDGEPGGVTPFTADVVPNGVRIILPRR